MKVFIGKMKLKKFYNYNWIFFIWCLPLGLTAQSDTTRLYFERNVDQLASSEIQKIQLDSSWESVRIIGSTDYIGSVAYNLELSQRRADNVKTQLKILGIDENIILEAKGVGIIGKRLNNDEGIPANRKVELIVKKKQVPLKEPEEEIVELEVEEVTKEELEEESLSEQIEALEEGDHLVLENLLFIPGQHYLLESSYPTMDALINILKENKSLEIAIEGHICCETQFRDGFDMETGKRNLSVARAEYIYSRLINQGIDPDRLSYEGFGRRKPLYPKERTDAEKQKNRRVELRIVNK